MRAIFRTIPIFGQHFISGCATISTGEKFFFKHEKNNIHDAYAVLAVDKNGDPLGWVPREISPAIVYLLNKKIKVYGVKVNSNCRMWAAKGSNFVADVVVS